MVYSLQDPAADKLHTLEWLNYLATGDSIDTFSWSITPAGPVITASAKSGTKTSCKVSGMTRGQVYQLTGEIVSTPAVETARQTVAIRCGFE